MAKKPPVKCLYCGESFYREDEEFIIVGRRYAHKKCGEYGDKIHALMKELLQEKYSPMKINKQMTTFYQEGYTIDSIYETLIYWYKIKKSDASKANGGIGIFPYVYPEFLQYKMQQDKIKNTNKNKKLNHYINIDEKEVEGKIDTKWKFRRVNFFNLK